MQKKHLYKVLAVVTLSVVALALSAVVSPLVHAAPPAFGGAGTSVRSGLPEPMNTLQSLFGILNTMMHVMLLIVIKLLEFLLSSDFYTEKGVVASISAIWKLCRDIMNLIFALMLIGVAFYTIIRANTDFVKSKWQQFVLAVVLVNMSWFFPRVIIDVANILTASIYSVPSMINFDCQMFDENAGPVPPGNPLPTKPCRVITDVKVFGDQNAQNQFCGGAPNPNCKCQEAIGCIKYGDFNNTNMNNQYAVLGALAGSFTRFDSLAQIPAMMPLGGAAPAATIASALKTSLKLFSAVAIGLILQVAIFFPLLGMAIGFTARILILWVTTALMPFTFAGVVVTGKPTTKFFGLEIDIWAEFMNAAFMPALVAAPMVIGLIMVSTGIKLPPPSGITSEVDDIVAGIPNIWGLLWAFVAAAIIWKGSFTALKKNQFISGMIGKLEGMGNYIASAAIKAPLLTPIPLPGGHQPQTLGSLVNMPRKMGQVIDNIASGRSNKTFGELWKDMSAGGGISQHAIDSAAHIQKSPDAAGKIKEALDGLASAKNKADWSAQMGQLKVHMGNMSGESDQHAFETLRDIVSNNRSAALTNKGVDMDRIQKAMNQEKEANK
jgi:hypothetical protein